MTNRSSQIVVAVLLTLVLLVAWLATRAGDDARMTAGAPGHGEGRKERLPDRGDQVTSLPENGQTKVYEKKDRAQPEAKPPTGTVRVRLFLPTHTQPPTGTVFIVNTETGQLEGNQLMDGKSVVATFLEIPVGPKNVVVVPDHQKFAPTYAGAVVHENSGEEVAVVLRTGDSIRGIVVDGSGQPLEGVVVSAVMELGYMLPEDMNRPAYGSVTVGGDGSGWSFLGSGRLSRRVVTRKDGTFVVPNIGWGPVRITASSGEGKSAEQWVSPGKEVRVIVSK